MRRKKRGNKKVFLFLILGVVIISLVGSLFILLSNISLTLPSFLRSKEIVNPAVVSAQDQALQQVLHDSGLTVDSMKTLSDGSGIQVTLKNGVVVIFATTKEYKEQVSSLQALLLRLTIDDDTNNNQSKVPKQIDFRPNRPVVSFTN